MIEYVKINTLLDLRVHLAACYECNRCFEIVSDIGFDFSVQLSTVIACSKNIEIQLSLLEDRNASEYCSLVDLALDYIKINNAGFVFPCGCVALSWPNNEQRRETSQHEWCLLERQAFAEMQKEGIL